jgi:hypothetical protein
MMDKYRKLELLKRSLGIRHKLKVHDSGKAPDTHEDLAVMLLAKWELEDELRAIEEVISDARMNSVASKKSAIERENASRENMTPFDREHRRKVGE